MLISRTWSTRIRCQTFSKSWVEQNLNFPVLAARPFQQRAISSKATNIILQSWSTGTQKQYAPYIKKWHDFCSKWKVNPYNPPLNTVLDFLVSLHEHGLSYTTINTARSALLAIILPTDNVNIGSHPIVSRFMKDIFKNNPPAPRYRTTRDVSPVLSYLSSLSKPNQSSLKSLTLKLFPPKEDKASTKPPHARHPVHERRGHLF